VDWYFVVGSTIAFSTFINAAATLSMISEYFVAILKRCLDRCCTCNTKRTSKKLQSEYQDLYKGGHQQLEVQYSQIIAITMIIMVLGSAMPILYLAGLTLCFCMFWGTKFLFVHFYRIPPKYGIELAMRVSSILELSAVIHAMCGCYMLTNPQIMPVQRIVR
jgi:hypothetical protein